MKVPAAMAVAAVVLAAMPPGATAQEAPRTDPELGSPAESIYGIPLEEARRDAAPDVAPRSALRSENGVGSSARIPGLDTVGRLSLPPGGPKGDTRLRPGPEPPAAPAGPTASVEPEPSTVGTSALITLTLLIGAGAGLVATRFGRRRAPPVSG